MPTSKKKANNVAATSGARELEQKRFLERWWWFDPAQAGEMDEAALAWEAIRRTSSYVALWQKAEAVVVGTTLQVTTGGHRTRLEVTEGEARFRRRDDGVEVAVKAGYFVIVTPNVPFSARPVRTDPHRAP